MKENYYNVNICEAYGGISRLSKASGVSPRNTKQWLMTQDAYTLHKSIRLKFKRRKVLAYGIGDLMQCDLVDMIKLSKYNNGVKYLLTAIDVFSKYAHAIPLKSKSADSLLDGFKKLFEEMKFVTNLQT